MMDLLHNKKELKKAYSFVEILISLGVISIIIVMLFNTVIVSFRVAAKISARSFVREEITSVVNAIARDIRNSDQILSCNGSSCTMVKGDLLISWESCNPIGQSETSEICRREYPANSYPPVVTDLVKETASSDILQVTIFTFEPISIGLTSDTQVNILITIVGSHQDPDLEINNIVRQTTISTRNYEI